jgi:hypothetical protein
MISGRRPVDAEYGGQESRVVFPPWPRVSAGALRQATTSRVKPCQVMFRMKAFMLPRRKAADGFH